MIVSNKIIKTPKNSKKLFSKFLKLSFVFVFSVFSLSCGEDYNEDMAISDAHAKLSNKDCGGALASLKAIHQSPDDFGYDGKIAWAGAEANTMAAFAGLSTSEHTALQRLGTAMFDSSGVANHNKTEHLMEAIRILQSTETGDSTEWTTEVSTNLMFLSMAAVGRFLNFHGYDGAGADHSQDFDLDDNIAPEVSCTDSYTNQTATLPDDTLGTGAGTGADRGRQY
jgi:hypothetical protein